MMRWSCCGVAVAGLIAIAATAEANSRLPDWISIAPEFSQSVDTSIATPFPTEEERASWEREGFGFVDLLWRIDIRIERSGMIESRVRMLRHFLTESGIAQGGNLNLQADAWRDQLTLESAYSVAPGGAPVAVDPDTIEIVSDDLPNVFSDLNVVVVPAPGLQVGSNAVVVATRRFQSKDLPLDWSMITALGNVVPIEHVEIRVTRESGAPPFAWATNDPALDCEKPDDHSLVCSRAHIPAVPLDPNVLSYSDLIPHFYVGAVDTWTDLVKEVSALVERSAKATPALRAKVEELGIAPEASDEEKLWSLLRFVADEIRYVALSHGDATVVPHPADLTLSRRYGDCKDKVTLLVAMARSAGLSVVPVLVSSERTVSENVLKPSSGYFDHMIACMDAKSGSRICVDPTQAYSGLEIPPQLGSAVALRIDPTQDSKPENLEVPAFGWQIHSRRTITMERDASTRTHDVRQMAGPGAAGNRTQILALSPADRYAWFEREYRDATGTTDEPKIEIRALRDAAVPYEVEYTATMPGTRQAARNQYLGVDPWLIYYARSMISVNKHHPYRMMGLRYTAEETIQHCCGRISLHAPTLDFESKYGTLERHASTIDGRLVVETSLELPAAVIPVDEVAAFEAFVMQSTRESAYWFSWASED